MPKPLFILLALQVALALPGAAQDGADYAGCGNEASGIFICNGECGVNSSDPRQVHTLAGEILQTKYAVRLVKEDLRVALRSKDNEQERYLAAWQLADLGQKDVIPDVYQAFEVEDQPRPKAYLACALVELGDHRGVDALHQYCKDDALPVDLRLDVARFLLEVHETPCIAPIVEALKGTCPYNWQAQAVIPHIKNLSPSDSEQLRVLLMDRLSDQGSAVRMVTAQTLSQLHDTAAIPAVQAAIAKERNPTVRKSMEDSLKNLQADQH